MVNTVLYRPTYSSWDPFKTLEELFFNWPSDSKPPIAKDWVYENGEKSGVKIQLAVAGFKLEDLDVYHQKSCLFISGDNSEREGVSSKFQSRFEKVLSVSSSFDLEKTKVSLYDGLLEIEIPLAEAPAKNSLPISTK